MSRDEKSLSDFEREMRRMGVRRMDRKGGARSPGRTQVPAKKLEEKQPARKEELPVAKPAPSSNPVLEKKLLTAGKENERLRSELEGVQARLEGAELELATLRAEALIEEAPSIERFLQTWGLSNEAEIAKWATFLASQGELRNFLYCLELKGAIRLHRILDRSILRHCSRAACLLGQSVYAIPVPQESCEICGGREPADWAAQLSDLLMLNGHRRIVLRGVRVALLRRLAEAVDDRLRVRVVPLEANLPFEPDGAELVLLWRLGGEESSEVGAHYRIKASSVAQFVERLGYQLQDEGA